LRLYALKIDKDCFVITGGAIKVSQKMQENGVFDSESFFELLSEQL
jgi:hypothetical protein